jgi:hypothetical protein
LRLRLPIAAWPQRPLGRRYQRKRRTFVHFFRP